MTLPQYKHTLPGQGFYSEDAERISQGARAGDEAMRTIIRNTSFGKAGRTQRGVIRVDDDRPLITTGPSGVSNNAFTAWIGAESAAEDAAPVAMRTTFVPGALQTFVVPAATGQRIDLIAARYQPRVLSGQETRQVKKPESNIVTEVPVSAYEHDLVSLVYLRGADGVEASWPVDQPGGYYIPLALLYVDSSWVSGTFPTNRIEVIANFSSQQGVAPATFATSSIHGSPGRSRPSFGASFGEIGVETMPTSMDFVVERLIPIDYGGATISARLIDDSIDWRDRVFQCFVEDNSTDNIASSFPWRQGYASVTAARMLSGKGLPGGAGFAFPTFGQTLKPVTASYGIGSPGGLIVAELKPMDDDLADLAYLYVDGAGALRLTTMSANNGGAFVWLRATAQYTNKA